MKIAVIGATGMAGSRIAAEAAARDHHVFGISRRTPEDTAPHGVNLSAADATDPEEMLRIAAGHDVVVLATRPAAGLEAESGSPTNTVLDAALRAGRRVVVIGGAGPLRSPDSHRLVLDDQRFVPPRWKSIARASVDQLAACTSHPADWTYVSPPALFAPGIRTGTYRRGGTTLLTDSEGVSKISAEDLAVAVVDDVESPLPPGRRFTVAD